MALGARAASAGKTASSSIFPQEVARAGSGSEADLVPFAAAEVAGSGSGADLVPFAAAEDVGADVGAASNDDVEQRLVSREGALGAFGRAEGGVRSWVCSLPFFGEGAPASAASSCAAAAAAAASKSEDEDVGGSFPPTPSLTVPLLAPDVASGIPAAVALRLLPSAAASPLPLTLGVDPPAPV